MKTPYLFREVRNRYIAAEAFLALSVSAHAFRDLTGLGDKCPEASFIPCALKAAVIGYLLGGTIDLGSHIIHYVIDKTINDLERPSKLEEKVAEKSD